MKETYLMAIEKTGSKAPSGSSAVWHAFNTTNESGVLPARLAIIFDKLSLVERRQLLQQAHFPDTFLQEKNEYNLRGNGQDVSVKIIDEALEHDYPANVLVMQLAQVDTLLPFLSDGPHKQWFVEAMSKLLQNEPSIQQTMRHHENPRHE